MTRAKLIMQITELQVQIDNLEVMARKYTEGSNYQATHQSLREARHDLQEAVSRLRIIDDQWLLKAEHNVETLKKWAEDADPGEKARLQDQIEEYKARIEKRKQSMQQYG